MLAPRTVLCEGCERKEGESLIKMDELNSQSYACFFVMTLAETNSYEAKLSNIMLNK